MINSKYSLNKQIWFFEVDFKNGKILKSKRNCNINVTPMLHI